MGVLGGFLGRWSFGRWIDLDGLEFCLHFFAFVNSWVWMMVFEARRLSVGTIQRLRICGILFAWMGWDGIA